MLACRRADILMIRHFAMPPFTMLLILFHFKRCWLISYAAGCAPPAMRYAHAMRIMPRYSMRCLRCAYDAAYDIIAKMLFLRHFYYYFYAHDTIIAIDTHAYVNTLIYAYAYAISRCRHITPFDAIFTRLMRHISHAAIATLFFALDITPPRRADFATPLSATRHFARATCC